MRVRVCVCTCVRECLRVLVYVCVGVFVCMCVVATFHLTALKQPKAVFRLRCRVDGNGRRTTKSFREGEEE